MNQATDRAALAARLSSRPDAERPASAAADTGTIREVRSSLDLPRAHHHQFTTWLSEVAFTLGVSPKWVGVQAGLQELVMLALTDQRTRDLLTERLRERVREQ